MVLCNARADRHIYIYTNIAKSRIERDYWPRFACYAHAARHYWSILNCLTHLMSPGHHSRSAAAEEDGSSLLPVGGVGSADDDEELPAAPSGSVSR